MKKNEQAINELLTRGVEEVIVREHLEKRIHAGEKLRVKLGIDPTGPHLHIGHAVELLKLRQFQKLGHQIVLIIGDFTSCIGDPTGKSEARKVLTKAQVTENMKTYLAQIQKVLDLKNVEVRYNGEWFYAMSPIELLQIASQFTVQRVLERDDFQKRLKADQDISALEILYPLFQGYDSVMVKTDVEIGGTDQKFNVLFGRRVQRRYGQPEQDVMTMKLLVDPTGKKMGKTEGNMIMLKDAPEEMYAKVMAWSDGMIVPGFELCTDVPMDEVQAIEKELKGRKVNPRDVKMRLAREIVALYHGATAAKKAEAAFVQTFQKHETPDNIQNFSIKQLRLGNSFPLRTLLLRLGLVKSLGEATRLVQQGGVKIDGTVMKNPQWMLSDITKEGILLQKGKRHFVRVMSE